MLRIGPAQRGLSLKIVKWKVTTLCGQVSCLLGITVCRTTLSSSIFYGDRNVPYLYCPIGNHVWLLRPWYVASVAEELNTKFYFILRNLILNSHMWLVDTILGGTAENPKTIFISWMTVTGTDLWQILPIWNHTPYDQGMTGGCNGRVQWEKEKR